MQEPRKKQEGLSTKNLGTGNIHILVDSEILGLPSKEVFLFSCIS